MNSLFASLDEGFRISFGNCKSSGYFRKRSIDAQSVKNTDTAMEKGYDAGKKVSGIKRHIAVDTQGLPHALAVTTADVTDRKGCLLALKRELDNLGAIQKIRGCTRLADMLPSENEDNTLQIKEKSTERTTPFFLC